jgi:hypothetical protein
MGRNFRSVVGNGIAFLYWKLEEYIILALAYASGAAASLFYIPQG